MHKVNVTIKTTGLNNTYINHFVVFINELTDGEYFGIKIKGSNVIIEEISSKHVSEIIDMLLFDGKDSYFQYNIIESINVEECK